MNMVRPSPNKYEASGHGGIFIGVACSKPSISATSIDILSTDTGTGGVIFIFQNSLDNNIGAFPFVNLSETRLADNKIPDVSFSRRGEPIIL
jgi:hypothetical protein